MKREQNFKMHNYQLLIEYDGTNFVGWQFQKNGLSIQDILEKKLKKILKKKVRLIGAGRTDKGVHAISQYANFFIDKKIEDKKYFLNSINFFLKSYLISVIDIKKKSQNFNSRYDAKERTYEYRIINRQAGLALNKNKAWHVKKKLDIKLLKQGAKLLKGVHNFSTFRASSCSASSPIRRLNNVKVKKRSSMIILQFKSKSFLQTQVRSMVGCLKYLSSKKWDLKKFKMVMKSKKRELCAPPAPACGLYLLKIRY